MNAHRTGIVHQDAPTDLMFIGERHAARQLLPLRSKLVDDQVDHPRDRSTLDEQLVRPLRWFDRGFESDAIVEFTRGDGQSHFGRDLFVNFHQIRLLLQIFLNRFVVTGRCLILISLSRSSTC